MYILSLLSWYMRYRAFDPFDTSSYTMGVWGEQLRKVRRYPRSPTGKLHSPVVTESQPQFRGDVPFRPAEPFEIHIADRSQTGYGS
jgi:hypothetical protein